MLATPRGRTPYDEVLGKRGAPPIPPPPPPRKYVDAANTSNTGNTRGARASGRGALDADPKWLEEAVLRIIQKHGLHLAAAEPVEVELDAEDLHFLPTPSPFWRSARTTLIVLVLAASAVTVARWRYPAQSATFLAATRAVAVRIGPPSAWGSALRARVRSLYTPVFSERTEKAPIAPSAAPTAVAEPVAPPPSLTATPTQPVAPVPAPSTVSIMSLPIAATDVPPAHPTPVVHHAVSRETPADVAPAASKPDAAEKHPAHAARVASPPPAETAAEPPPGSLAEAIKRAGTGPKPAAAPERATTPDPKPATDATLPERPSASMVTSALLAVLPDARACMNDGDEARPAVVVFESNGAVGSVQVSGASAPCIQKALSRAHVAPFAQPSYRATVPVRPN